MNEFDAGEDNRNKKQDLKSDAIKVRGSLSAYMNWPIAVSIGLIILCCAVTMVDWAAGAVASACSIVIVVLIMLLSAYYHRRINSDMVEFGAGYAQIQKQLLQEMQVPYAVTDENGRIIWMNKEFLNIVHLNNKSHKSLSALFPGIEKQYPRGRKTSVIHSQYLDRKYQIIIKGVPVKDIMETVVDSGDQDSGRPLMFAVYLYDETTKLEWEQMVEDEKMVAALIYMDNYDEVMESTEEVRKTLLSALVDRQITKYVNNYQGVIKRLENDKYFAVFSNKYLKEMQANGFSICEDVKKIKIGNGVSVTISIGLGVNGGSYLKNYDYARMAMDMALGRGGDQAVLKNQDDITYYGGRSQSQGKNTRVKARVKAQALRELMTSAGNILIMGHRISDADCIGAAIGIFRAAQTSQRPANIVLNNPSNGIKPMLERLKKDGDYSEGLFVNNDEAQRLLKEDTLLVVVDNNRASYSECPELIELAKNIVVLDHHRQSKDHIENAVLSYIEPYASSASEMVAEILQYYSEDIKLRPSDAEAMYSGIVVDTNNFMNKTGVRTFEAAAFLRRNGADITRVRKLFRDDMEDYKAKAEAVREVEMYMDCYAISVCPGNMSVSPTIIASQAANELLGIQGIKASFVFTEFDDQVFISARSIDEVNVQTIMEKLGGGGHLSMAGAQLKGKTIDEAINMLKEILSKQDIDNSNETVRKE